MQDFDFSGYNNQLLKDIGDQLSGGDDESLVAVMAELITNVEHTLAENLKPADYEMMDCKAGCGTCCIVNVAVLDPEVVNIGKYLRSTCTVAELTTLKQSMRNLLVHICDLDEDERIATRKRCVFLTADGNCSIYPVRPLLCRAITSINANDCLDSLAMQALGEQIPVTMNLFQKSLFDVTYQALAAALAGVGLNDSSRELTAAVLAYLEG